MRRSFLVLSASLVASAISHHAFAQNSSFWDGTKSDEEISLTVQAGLNVSKFTHVDRWDKMKVGANIGVMAEKPIFNSLSVKAGLFYTMKGAVGKNDAGFGGTLTTTFSPTYLEFPVLASYRYEQGDNLRFQFDFGPYFAVGLHGKDVKENSGNGSYSKPSKVEYKLFSGKDAQLKRVDFGFRFGPEVVWKDKFSAGLAYEFSVISISKNMGNGKIGNGNMMINLGYKFTTF